MEEVQYAFGRLDILVANAGISKPAAIAGGLAAMCRQYGVNIG